LRQVAVSLMGRTGDPHRALYRTLTFEMNRFQPHIVHAEEEPDSLAALQVAFARHLFAPQAKLVLYTWQNVDRPKRWYVKAVLRATLRASDAVLCANHEAKELLMRIGYRKHLAVLPAIGVDTLVFAPDSRRTYDRTWFTVGYLGRLVVEKGIDTLIEAVAQVAQSMPRPGIRLMVIGDGPQRGALEAQAACLGDRVKFVAPMPPMQVAQQMNQLDALVLPSRSTPVWKEQFGRVLTEAMACQVPVIGSNSGAIPEVIGDAGLIFPEGDAIALANCLRQLIESPDLQRELSELGYARVMQHYTQEQIAEWTAAFYRRIMSNGSQ
jgi:glycosyltransferase involved in cell wall biosynthesis